ncbi:MAG: hypothetical protein IJY20_07190 [Clostridia bacterium]|nr:hypothetical protein [Clostridia bacterium]
MYKRAYPPRDTPLPENYSGVALMAEKDLPPEEEEEQVAEETIATLPPEDSSQEEEPTPAAKEASCDAKPLPPSFATSDMLLLAIAALMSQNGQPEGELVMILLLLLLGE